MKKTISVKEILLSIAYLLVVIILMLGINFLIAWLFENVIFDMLEWFNRKKTWVKIILFIFGFGTILGLILNFAG